MIVELHATGTGIMSGAAGQTPQMEGASLPGKWNVCL